MPLEFMEWWERRSGLPLTVNEGYMRDKYEKEYLSQFDDDHPSNNRRMCERYPTNTKPHQTKKETTLERSITKDIKHRPKTKGPQWEPLHNSLIEFKKEVGMTPNAFYVICHLRKDRAFYKWGKIIPEVCKEIYNRGYSVTYIKSISSYADELGLSRNTVKTALEELEELKIAFTRRTEDGLFVITGHHYDDDTETMFSDIPEEDRKCELFKS